MFLVIIVNCDSTEWSAQRLPLFWFERGGPCAEKRQRNFIHFLSSIRRHVFFFFRASTVCVVAGASSTHLSSFRLPLLSWVGKRVGGCPGGGFRSPWGALSGTDRRGAGARTSPEAAALAVDSVGSPTEARGEKGGRRKQQWTDGNKSTRNKMLQIAQGNELHPSTARIRAARCQ